MFQEVRYEVSLHDEEHRVIENALGRGSIGQLLRDALSAMEKEQAGLNEIYGALDGEDEDDLNQYISRI